MHQSHNENNIKIADATTEKDVFEIREDVLLRYNGSEESVVVPKGVRVIGEYAFTATSGIENTSLKEVFLPSTVEIIRSGAFMDCSKLCRVHFMEKSNLTSIMKMAFKSCRDLQEIDLPDSLSYIGIGAFESCNLQAVNIPKHTAYIGYDAFAFNQKLKMFSVDSKNECYGAYDGILYQLEEKKLVKCPAAKCGEVFIPEQMTWITSRAFAGCRNIEKIVFLGSCYIIEGEVFRFCTKLTSLNIPYTESISWDTFEDIGDCVITIRVDVDNREVIDLIHKLQEKGYHILCETD